MPARVVCSVVCVHVNGTICTSKKSSASAATVRLMPSSAIDPLRDDLSGERVRITHAQPPEFTFRADVHDRADGVDMSLHEVAPEPRVTAHRALEVRDRSGLKLAQRCHLHRLRPDVERRSTAARLDDGEADAVDGNAFTGRDVVADRARDEEPRRTGQVLDSDHVADRLNEAGEHIQ